MSNPPTHSVLQIKLRLVEDLGKAWDGLWASIVISGSETEFETSTRPTAEGSVIIEEWAKLVVANGLVSFEARVGLSQRAR
jgi:hypothetical protein